MMRTIIAVALALLATPAAAQSVATPTAAPALTSSLIIRSGGGYLTGFNVTSGATAGYVMLFDAAAVPADGAVAPLRCVPLAANTGLDANYRSAPLRFTMGIIVVFSSTGCFNKTASATAFIAGDVR